MSLSVSYQKVIISLMIFNVFFPTFNNLFDRTGSTGVIVINFAMLIAIIGLLVVLNCNELFKIDNVIICFYFVFIVYIISVLSTSLLNNNLIVADVFELFRPVYYFSSFALFYLLSKNRLIDPDEIVKVFAVIVLISAFFSLTNIVFFNSFGREVMSFYAKDTLLPTRRFTGTFQNPYDFAFIGTLPLVYYLNSFITRGGIRNVLFVLVLFVTIIFGQSKSGVITFLSISFIALILSPLFVKKDKLTKDMGYLLRLLSFPTVMILSFVVFIVLYADQFSYLIDGLVKLSSGGDRSTSIRLEQANLALNMLTEGYFRLLLGYGSYKYSDLLFESLYTLYFFRYGLLALVFLFFWVMVPLVVIFLIRFSKNRNLKSSTLLVLLCFFVAVIPSGFGNNIIDQSRIPFVYFGFLGIVFDSYFHRKK